MRKNTLYEPVIYSETNDIPKYVYDLADKLDTKIIYDGTEVDSAKPILRVSANGLSLEVGGQLMRFDFTNMSRRIKRANLSHELLVRAAKIKNADPPLTVIDATAGLGEDSFLLAAAGFRVKMYERNPVIAALLCDALERAKLSPEICDVAQNMEAYGADSILELGRLDYRADIIFLDPMFPEKTKNSLTKKKFQLLHHLELPCTDEEELLSSAIAAHPRKIVIKRPVKGKFLAGKKPDYSLSGKTIRYDCIVFTD